MKNAWIDLRDCDGPLIRVILLQQAEVGDGLGGTYHFYQIEGLLSK